MKNFTIIWIENGTIYYESLKGHDIEEISAWFKERWPERILIVCGQTKHLRIERDGAKEMKLSIHVVGVHDEPRSTQETF